jgi:hypothetical protein
LSEGADIESICFWFASLAPASGDQSAFHNSPHPAVDNRDPNRYNDGDDQSPVKRRIRQ